MLLPSDDLMNGFNWRIEKTKNNQNQVHNKENRKTPKDKKHLNTEHCDTGDTPGDDDTEQVGFTPREMKIFRSNVYDNNQLRHQKDSLEISEEQESQMDFNVDKKNRPQKQPNKSEQKTKRIKNLMYVKDRKKYCKDQNVLNKTIISLA